MTPLSLPERILALERALVAVPHAFGGALALAYYAEPRATIDIDLNVFVHADHFPDVATPLVELGVAADDPRAIASVARDGQVRVTDGPYSETKEVLGGYYIIEAGSYDQAIERSRDCPHLEYGGTIEVREVDKI